VLADFSEESFSASSYGSISFEFVVRRATQYAVRDIAILPVDAVLCEEFVKK
jgi:hypothetical protein